MSYRIIYGESAKLDDVETSLAVGRAVHELKIYTAIDYCVESLR
jgi:hypothetical protein